MKEREFDALLEALEDVVNSQKSPQIIVSEVKELIARSKTEGNVDNEFMVPRLSSTPPEPHTIGLIEALKDAALKIKGGEQDTEPEPIVPGPHVGALRHVVYPEGPRAAAFQRCFPFHAKYFQYNTKKTSILKRSSRSIFTTGFTPNAAHFALCAPNGSYYIYSLPTEDLDDGPSLKYSGSVPADQHFFMALNNDWLVICSSSGTIHVISLETGETLWTHTLKFSVGALGMSISGSYIGVAINTASREGNRQPMVLLLCPDTCAGNLLPFKSVVEITFISPYTDPIRKLAFSPDELHIVCSTSLESRFFLVSLMDPREPRLVTRSSRKVPQEKYYDYEGITSVSFFPRRSAVTITSVAPNSPPIVLDPRITPHPLNMDSNTQSLSSSSSRSQSQILLRADKVGSSIHNAVISPHENAIAFLDKTGLVYIVYWPKNMDHSKKVSVVFELTGSRTSDVCASLSFSEDGTILYAVDCKGVLHIADFGAALPSTAGITRLRPLS